MKDVVYVLDHGPVHAELVALGVTDMHTGAQEACSRLKGSEGEDGGHLTSDARVEDSVVTVIVLGDGVRLHLAFQLQPNVIRRTALVEVSDHKPEEPPCPASAAPPTTAAEKISSPPS